MSTDKPAYQEIRRHLEDATGLAYGLLDLRLVTRLLDLLDEMSTAGVDPGRSALARPDVIRSAPAGKGTKS